MVAGIVYVSLHWVEICREILFLQIKIIAKGLSSMT